MKAVTDNKETSDNEFVNDVKLKKLNHAIFGLQRNGFDLTCRYEQTRICNSGCSSFHMEKSVRMGAKEEQYVVELGCGNGHNPYKINEIIPYVKPE